MKLAGARIESFLRKPDPAVIAALVYGPDRGLVRERADRLVLAVAGCRDDAFRISELAPEQLKDDPARLRAEAAALSFSGGRRVVRVREAKDGHTDALRALLEGGADGLVVLEAGELGPRSPLRLAAEAAPNAAALPCYVDEGEALRRLIVGELADAGLGVGDEAADLLTGLLGADRGLTRSELAKLVLYMDGPDRSGPDMNGPRTVEVDDVLAVIGDARQLSTDAIAHAACGGDFAALDRGLKALAAEGTSAIPILRAVARHLQRLLQARTLVAGGLTPKQAVDGLKPPVHFRWRPAFERQAAIWTPRRLAAAMLQVTEAELACKQTGAPQEMICHRALMRLGQLATAEPAAPTRRRP